MLSVYCGVHTNWKEFKCKHKIQVSNTIKVTFLKKAACNIEIFVQWIRIRNPADLYAVNVTKPKI